LEKCHLIWRNIENGRSQVMRRILYYLNQPFFFPLHYNMNYFPFWVVGQERLFQCTSRNLFYGRRLTGMSIPFQTQENSYLKNVGSGFFRLEKLDDSPYLGLRLMKIVEPPQLTREKITRCSIDMPIEGELVRRKGEALRLDMDEETLRALGELPVINGMDHAQLTNAATESLF